MGIEPESYPKNLKLTILRQLTDMNSVFPFLRYKFLILDNLDAETISNCLNNIFFIQSLFKRKISHCQED